MKRPLILVIFFICASSFIRSADAAWILYEPTAQVIVDSRGQYSELFTPFNSTPYVFTETGNSQQLVVDRSVGGTYSSASGEVQSGVLRAFVEGHAASDGSSYLYAGWGSATVSFQTNLVIHSPTVPDGTPGTFIVSLEVGGSHHLIFDYASNGSVQNGFNAFFRVAGSTGFKFLNPSSFTASAGDTRYFVTPGTPDSLSILLNPSFVFGEPFPVRAEMTVSARATASGFSPFSGIGVADFSHTAYWGGVSNLLLADGTPVANFSVLDADGVSWSQGMISSVPEPSSLILAALGLVSMYGPVQFWRRQESRTNPSK